MTGIYQKSCIKIGETTKDNVNHPTHYTAGKVECIDAIEAAVTNLNGFEGVCVGNAIKYLFRWKLKGGIESLQKARWYIDRLIYSLESEVKKE